MYVYACMYVYIYMYMYVYICVCVYVQLYTQAGVYIYIIIFVLFASLLQHIGKILQGEVESRLLNIAVLHNFLNADTFSTWTITL